MERIKAAANSRLMRLAQKMIVGGALLLDRVANSHLHYKVNYHLRFEKTMPPYK